MSRCGADAEQFLDPSTRRTYLLTPAARGSTKTRGRDSHPALAAVSPGAPAYAVCGRHQQHHCARLPAEHRDLTTCAMRAPPARTAGRTTGGESEQPVPPARIRSYSRTRATPATTSCMFAVAATRASTALSSPYATMIRHPASSSTLCCPIDGRRLHGRAHHPRCRPATLRSLVAELRRTLVEEYR